MNHVYRFIVYVDASPPGADLTIEPRASKPWRILVPPRCPTSVLLATCVCHAMKGKGLPWLRQGAETNGHSWEFFWVNEPPPKK